jgi:lipid-binding SYLF domain-containing protein
VVAAALDLTDSDAKAFWPVYNACQSDMVVHYDRVLKLVAAYAATYQTMTDEAATLLLGEFLALEADHVALLSKYVPRFRRVLAPAKGRSPLPSGEQAPCVRELRARARDPVAQVRGGRTMHEVRRGVCLLFAALALAVIAQTAVAAPGAEIDREVDAALAKLYADVPGARHLGSRAHGVLVFPNVAKAGFLYGAQYGEGALRRGGRTVGYYGLQAGLQVFGYALFFMSDAALQYLDTSGGFELGTGPSIVVLDAGAAKGLSTSTVQHGIYAIFFDQQGLMAGLGLQGWKISRIEP